MRKVIKTDMAPAAIGPSTMTVIDGEFEEQAHQVFKNLAAIAKAAGLALADAVKLTVYLTDLDDFASLNEVMAIHMSAPFPARAAVQVSALPKGVALEIDAVLHQDQAQ